MIAIRKPTLQQLAFLYGDDTARGMLDAPALPAIRAALERAPGSVLDRPVGFAGELSAVTSGLWQWKHSYFCPSLEN